MRHLLVLGVVFLVGVTTPVLANTMACGLKPLAPLGCSSANARCVCDADGQCRWVFDC
jgi:hypothetical protein